MKNWRKLAALCLAGIMVFALAACTQEDETPGTTDSQSSTDTPSASTGDGSSVVETPLNYVDPETYQEYIGVWYADGSSAGYRINIKDTGTWELTDAAEEIISSGGLRVNQEENILEMYDPDGSLAITVALEEEGVLHADVMVEFLTDTLSTNYFYNKITNNISDSSIDVDDSSSIGGDIDTDTVVTPSDEDVTG